MRKKRQPKLQVKSNKSLRISAVVSLRPAKREDLQLGPKLSVEFPIVQCRILADLCQSIELHQSESSNATEAEKCEYLRQMIIARQPQLCPRPDHDRILHWIRAVVGSYLERYPLSCSRETRPATILELLDRAKARALADNATACIASKYRTLARLVTQHLGRKTRIDIEPYLWERVRQQMVDEGKTRSSVGSYMALIVEAYSWASYHGWVDDQIARRLERMPELPAESFRAVRAIRAVPDETIRATLGAAPWKRRTKQMVRFQRLVGCRPGELCDMEWSAITGWSGKILQWRVSRHKTARRTGDKIYMIGPKARAIIRERIYTNDSRFVWTTRSGQAVSLKQYRREIHCLCDRAKIPRWNPNQLRHSRSTEVTRAYGLTAEAASLGHSIKIAQQVYVERDLPLAEKVASEIG